MTDQQSPIVSRRHLGGLTALVAFAGMAGPARAALKAPAVAGRTVHVPTITGKTAAKFFAGAGARQRGLVMWGKGDAASASVAEKLAADGWAVLLVDSAIDADFANRHARDYVAWLDAQAEVAPTSSQKAGSLGRGYSLRNVSAALPRFAFATAAERKMAAASAVLFAVPDVAVSASRGHGLAQAARVVARA